jgi:perosamine synthetase
MYAITVQEPFPLGRDELAGRLRERGVDTRTFFCPMNRQPFLLEQEGFRQTECPVADRLWETGLYLPSSITLEDEDIEAIVEEIHAAAEARV